MANPLSLRSGAIKGIAVVLILSALGVSPLYAAIHVAILPASVAVEPGNEFVVELTITEAGSAFNGFYAIVGYDPDLLTFIEMPAVEQQGQLMQDACANSPFHSFQIAPDSTSLSISYVLLCAGVSVTGPGVIYHLRFQAGPQNATTALTLLEGTEFYFAGIIIPELFTEDAEVVIGTGTDVPPERPVNGLNLRAAPNPFNPQTVISFRVLQSSPTTLSVFSVDGRLVTELIDTVLDRGVHSIVWNGRDQYGKQLASSIYHLRLETSGQTEIRPIMLVK